MSKLLTAQEGSVLDSVLGEKRSVVRYGLMTFYVYQYNRRGIDDTIVLLHKDLGVTTSFRKYPEQDLWMIVDDFEEYKLSLSWLAQLQMTLKWPIEAKIRNSVKAIVPTMYTPLPF